MSRFLKLTAGSLALTAFAGVTGGRLASQASPDWPQWRGPNRDGVLASFVEPKTWPETLTQKWKLTVGVGYATPVLIGTRLYMFARQDANEVMMAIDADTGKIAWQAGYPAPVRINPVAARHGEGPKSTPAFANGKLYTLGMGGIVTAWDASTGKVLWQKEAAAVLPSFGTAQSPIVDRGLVILHVGGNNNGALSAFDANTGEVKWAWTGDGPAYGSPVLAEFGGVRQVIVMAQKTLVGVSAATGELLWQRPLTSPSAQNSITPIVYGQTVIVSALQNPVTAFTVTKSGAQWTTEDVWVNQDASLYMSNAVVVGNALFGFSNRNGGQFFCVDARTGKTLWMGEPRQGTNAAITGAGNLVFLLKESGELIVARSSVAGFEPVHRYTVADSATWAQPAMSGHRLFVKDVSTLALWTID
jgi:outer membrane protein assembly factor BamB